VDGLGLEQAVDRLCQRIVRTVTGAADRRLNVCFGKTFGVANGQVLLAPVAVVDQPRAIGRAAIMNCLFQSS